MNVDLKFASYINYRGYYSHVYFVYYLSSLLSNTSPKIVAGTRSATVALAVLPVAEITYPPSPPKTWGASCAGCWAAAINGNTVSLKSGDVESGINLVVPDPGPAAGLGNLLWNKSP